MMVTTTMRLLLTVIGLFCAFSTADIWEPEPRGNHYGQHYTQHHDIVSSAKRGLNDKLNQLGLHNDDFEQRANLQYNHSPELCLYPCESSQYANKIRSSIDRSSERKPYSSNLIIPSKSESKFTHSSSQHESSASTPILIPVSRSESQRYSQSQSEHQSERHSSSPSAYSQPYVYPTGQQYDQQYRYSGVPVHTDTRPSTTSQQYSGQSERFNEHKESSQTPYYYYPSISNINQYNPSNPDRDQERYTTPVVRQQYYPSSQSRSSASERQSSRSEKVSHSQTLPIVTPVYTTNSSRQTTRDDRDSFSKSSIISRPPHVVPSSQAHQRDRLYDDNTEVISAVAPAYPSNDLTSSLRYSSADKYENYDNKIHQPIILPSQTSSASSSHYNSRSIQESQSSNPNYVSAIPSGLSSSQSRQSSMGANSEFGRSSFGSDRDRESSRLHSTGGYNSNSHLTRYMSESERLAKEQGEGVRTTGTLVGSSIVNTNYDSNGGSNSLNDNLSDIAKANGFVRAKSWERKSKWSSGSEYDETGKINSYNTLSTGEGEQHHVNGKTVGYKAATTTLDDNGKVSTYTIHTS